MKKFVIIAQPRTGTSMLVNTLNGIDCFNVYGELFVRVHNMNNINHPQKIQDQMIKRFIKNSYDLSNKKSVDDFLDFIYKSDDAITGFKLLSTHLNRKEGNDIINYIQKNKIYKIILYRENKLKQVISSITNKKEGKVYVKPKMIVEKIKKNISEEKKLFNYFANGKYVKKSYESLTSENDIDSLNINWIYNLLDYHGNPIVKVPLRKYRPRSVSDNIDNFESLVHYIKNKSPEFLEWIK
jgi:LPS sulfotransferase NodH